ncbi:hypothetical protein [Haloechinothrix halophila]|uniref:hypothetical protein n=1 Tax=Haloechinothrix halophila TaxID=1069073 RepID=UPI0003F809A4|nr:hypothetical protein [Haloechinothrix halophila]
MRRCIGYGVAMPPTASLGEPRDAVGAVALLAIMATTFTAVGRWQTRRGAGSSRSSCAGLAAVVAVGRSSSPRIPEAS